MSEKEREQLRRSMLRAGLTGLAIALIPGSKALSASSSESPSENSPPISKNRNGYCRSMNCELRCQGGCAVTRT